MAATRLNTFLPIIVIIYDFCVCGIHFHLRRSFNSCMTLTSYAENVHEILQHDDGFLFVYAFGLMMMEWVIIGQLPSLAIELELYHAQKMLNNSII